MASGRMRISALITTFNRREYIERAIQSVLTQTVPVDEVVVVDDGSTDGTAELISHRFGNLVRVVCQANQGVSGARRRALRESSHDWVAFLDSDDEWTPDRNRLFTEAGLDLPADVAWIFGDSLIVRDHGKCKSLFEQFGLHVQTSPQIFEDPLAVQYPFQFGMLQASVIRKSALLEIRAFEEGLRHSEDFLAGVQIACRYRFAAIPTIVTNIYRTSDLMSSSLSLPGSNDIDYHRARVMAYLLIAQSKQEKSWDKLYAGAVRGLCEFLAERGHGPGRLALQQFVSGFSWKSVLFLCVTMLGRRGVRLWQGLSKASEVILKRKAGNEPAHLVIR